jgi:hypothetical protein
MAKQGLAALAELDRIHRLRLSVKALENEANKYGPDNRMANDLRKAAERGYEEIRVLEGQE